METSALYRVQREDLPRLQKMLTECFAEDPLYHTLIPDPETRKRLMPELFEQCGWTGPSFLQLAQEVREVTPLVHQQGVYLTEDGQLTDHLSGEVADRLNEFFFAQYYREHKVVPEGAG